MEEVSVIRYLKLLKDYLQLRKTPSLIKAENFIREFYDVSNMTPEFYELFIQNIRSKKLLKIIINQDIYSLISYLKYDSEQIEDIEEYLSLQDYYKIPKRQINKLESLLQEMSIEDNPLSQKISEELQWKLRRRATYQPSEYSELAYKLYIAFGFENASELITGKYGQINYEQLHYLIKNIDLKTLSAETKERIKLYLFGDKKNYNNPIRQMLSGRIPALFIHFDYFYNKNNYFIEKLGQKLPLEKVKLLLQERYITTEPTTPEITAELREDMVSSYYHKYIESQPEEKEVIDKNISIYVNKLRNKYASSIPQVPLSSKNEITPELLNLSDARNLTHGYRSGNCFRINGEASILFSKFLESEHMRILSFSTPEYKDYAMVLLMRNGNVLIAQGIEASKWVTQEIKGKRLYEIVKESMKEIMDYMNANGDEIVATIIGATNQNVTSYNNQILPFLVPPILENSSNYYNGLSNYQCLLDLSPSKTIRDMKAYTPTVRYFDKRDAILSRRNNYPEQEIERRLISLRYQRTQTPEGFSFYQTITNHHEQETICNKDWYVTLFTDHTIDSFLADTQDPRAKEEYQQALNKIYKKIKSTKPRL